MSEWKECPKCKCMNLNRQHCVDCGRDLKEVAPENQQPTPTAEAKPDCAPRSGSALTDAQKIDKAIELLQWMHDNCLAPDITAHDAVNTCRICRLIAELKAPNDEVSHAGRKP